MNKLVLWFLFDDGNCSYAKAIFKYPETFSSYDKVLVFSMGKNELNEQLKE
ncbi:hypothetical protein BCF89_11212, partial [Metamycoplasma auris]